MADPRWGGRWVPNYGTDEPCNEPQLVAPPPPPKKPRQTPFQPAFRQPLRQPLPNSTADAPYELSDSSNTDEGPAQRALEERSLHDGAHRATPTPDTPIKAAVTTSFMPAAAVPQGLEVWQAASRSVLLGSCLPLQCEDMLDGRVL